ncbi:MAG: nuclear transport factor 2 family protein [Pseudomonadales bacterium]
MAAPMLPQTSLDAPFSAHYVQARQEIEYLRRWYCRATDLFGMTGNGAATDEARRIYRRIFTADANIRVSGATGRPLQARGPDGWAAVVTEALRDYTVTQHLLGTQLVDFRVLTPEEDEGGSYRLRAGEACLSSYLQAWHVWPDNRLRVVMGNYLDEVRYVPGTGWQIHDMNLVHLTSEVRPLGSV